MDLITKIKKIIQTKHTKVCLALDVTDTSDLFYFIELLGEHFCILKLHHDIINNFNMDTITKLNLYKQRYNFLIWEDRKFADIGHIMEQQISKISHWADMVSIHPIAGIESVKQISKCLKTGIILIGELSSKNNLINEEYKKNVIDISNRVPNMIGIVCQSKMSDTLLNIVPGISLTQSGDDKGQQYSTLNDRKFADVFVVGRSIINSKDPLQTIKNYSLLSTKYAF